MINNLDDTAPTITSGATVLLMKILVLVKPFILTADDSADVADAPISFWQRAVILR